jgi:hypothetical protein
LLRRRRGGSTKELSNRQSLTWMGEEGQRADVDVGTTELEIKAVPND